MKKILVLLFLLFSVKDIEAYSWIKTNAGGSANRTGVVSSITGNRMIMTANPGYVYISNNYGQKWTPRITAGYNNWAGIASSSDTNKIIIIPSQGFPLISNNFGFSWLQKTNVGTSSTYWASVASSGDGTNIMAGTQEGTVYISTNSGLNWTEQTNVSGYVVDISSNGQVMVMPTTDGKLKISTNGGNDWTEEVPPDVDMYFKYAKISPDGTKIIGYAEDESGDIQKIYFSSTTNFNWTQPAPFNARSDIYTPKISFSANGQKIVIFSEGNTFVSIDFGVTWDQEITSLSDMYTIDMTDDGGILVAVGNYGVYLSNNLGTTWTRYNGGAGGGWSFLSGLADNQTLMAMEGQQSYLNISNNSGVTWTRQDSLGIGSWRGAVVSNDGGRITALSYSDYNDAERIVGGIYTTVDNGQNWTELTEAGRAFWVSLASSANGQNLIAANTGYGCGLEGCGNEGDIFLSTDYGSHWTKNLNAGTKIWEKVGSSSDGTKLIAITGATDPVLYSSNSGATWNGLNGMPANSWWKDVAMSADGSKLVLIGPQGIYISNNSGGSWQEETRLDLQTWNSVSMSADGGEMIITGNNDIYVTTNSGATWVKQVGLIRSDRWVGSLVSSDGSRVAVANSAGGFIYIGGNVNPFSAVIDCLSNMGITTNLGDITDFSNASDIYFYKPGDARIMLQLNADLTDSTVVDWIMDICSKINLMTAYIELDADSVKDFLPTQSTLTMYNIDMTSPQILVDGVPDTQNVVSNIVYDEVLHTLTFDTAHFTSFSVVDGSGTTPATVIASNNQGVNNSINSVASCNDSKPVSSPSLFQIDTKKTSAKLFFTPISSTNKYFISFSTKPNAEEHGAEVSLTREGVQNFTVNLLKPNTTYYFKVRGQNGCQPGEWSNILKIKTNSQKYYKNISAKKIVKLNTVTTVKKTLPKINQVVEPTPKPMVTIVPTQAPKKSCFLWWCR